VSFYPLNVVVIYDGKIDQNTCPKFDGKKLYNMKSHRRRRTQCKYDFFPPIPPSSIFRAGTGGDHSPFFLQYFFFFSQNIPTCRTELFLFGIKFVEGMWIEHDTFVVAAMPETEQVADLVGSFLGNPVDEVFVVFIAPVIFVLEPGTGNDRYTGRRSCESKNKVKARCKDVVPKDEEYGRFDPVKVHERRHIVEDRACVHLVPVPEIPAYGHGILGNIEREPCDTGDAPQHGPGKARRGPAIPKNKDIHSHSILRWRGINILSNVSAGTSQIAIIAS
jgi:hypothetical protein